MNVIDHQKIEQQGMIDRYFRGDLAPDEEARFEQHFFACAACQEELEAARGLAQGIKAAAAEDLARIAAARQLGILAWLGRRSRGVQAALLAAPLAAVLALALLPSSPLERGAAPPTPSSEALVLLAEFRGEARATVISAKQADQPLVLAVDPGVDPRFVAYNAQLLDASGALVFAARELEPNALEVLSVRFPARFFAAGKYRLVLFGVDANGAVSELATHRFHVAGG